MEVTVRGNLGADPEVVTLPSGTIAGRMRVAVTQGPAERERKSPTVWLDVRAYGDLAQRCGDALHSGDPVLVNGHMRAEEWKAEDGSTRRRTYVYATGAGPDLSRCVVAGVTRPKRLATAEHTDAEQPPADPFDED